MKDGPFSSSFNEASPADLKEEKCIFDILCAIAEDAEISQRQIATKTGLALSKVNFVLKKLSDKGMLKLRRARKNPRKLAYLYLLTPKGLIEKSRLTYRFIGRTLRQYSEAENRILLGLRRISSDGLCRVILLGLNETTDLFVRLLRTFDNINLIGIADDKQTGMFDGDIPLIRPDHLPAIDFDYLIPTSDCDWDRYGFFNSPVETKIVYI